MGTVRFRLNHPKDKQGNLKSELCPILVEFYSKYCRMELSTGLKVYPANWNSGRVSSKEKDWKEINTKLARIETDIMDVWEADRKKPIDELKANIRKAIKEDESAPVIIEKKTVVEAVQRFIAQYEREKESGTVKRYRALLKKLIAFNPNLTFEELDFNFYNAFKSFLYDTPNPNYIGYHLEYDSHNSVHVVTPGTVPDKFIGLLDDVVFKYFINLKTICAWAGKRDYKPNSAYKEWEIIKREYPAISLSLHELKKVEEIVLPAHLDIARDYLSLECRTGQRISDLKRFDKSDINGNLWTFTQKKGNRLNANRISLPLVGYCAPALLIIQKHNFELPKITEAKLNKYIKTVCKEAFIDTPMYIERWAGNKKVRIPGLKYEFLSTHTGRKTFITTCLQSKQFSTHTVMQITGIRSEKTLRHYFSGSEIGTIEAGLRGIEDDRSAMRIAN